MIEVENSQPGTGTDTAACGVAVIEAQLKTLPQSPGVYRMINAAGDVLYVGKAKNLKKRVTSYCHLDRLSMRIRRMVRETAAMEFVTTHTEAEALLLEANLIKRFLPRFNILLRDDKSFPSILVTGDHAFPRVLKVRGARDRKGMYFGPFASAWSVNETLTVLQRAFLLRSCSDTVFEARTRPCLLHQIKRCSAPCVKRINEADYAALVDQARRFLSGESQTIQQELARRMQEASDRVDFETAAQYRDRIQALTRIQSHQDINVAGIEAADVVASYQEGGHTCIQVFFFRSGRNYGNRAYFPSHAQDQTAAEVMEAFIGQFYSNKPPPPLVLVNVQIENRALVEDALSVRAERRVHVECPVRGDKHKLVAHAEANAREALSRRLAEGASQQRLLEELATALSLDGVPERIEVYDNSHVSGTNAVGAMIVAGPEGFVKNAYRKFNIRGTAAPATGETEVTEPGMTPGDDFAMMREVLTRRFSRALREDEDRSRGQWPDLILIDGGAGQLSAVRAVLAELGIDDVPVAGVAKGPERNAGRERIFVPDREPIVLDRRDPVLYLIQRLRDEAHRFAIGTHRARRSKAIKVSALDDIPGIGAKRKKALLHHFGSARAVSAAGLADLEAVEGIDRGIAKKVYDWFHADR